VAEVTTRRVPRLANRLVTVSALALAACLVPVGLGGQQVYDRNRPKEPGARTWLARKATLPAFQPPRLADGRPNLQGQWGGSSSGDSIEEIAAIDMTTPYAESWIADPASGVIPYQPWALAERNRHRAGLARGWPGETGERLFADPQTFCLKNVPRYAQRGFELVQQPGSVVMMLNWGHHYRVIPLDGRPHIGGTAAFWMGNPRGRWDGDTLVVDVMNLNGKMWLDSVGNFYSDRARVTERFRLVEANMLDYAVTIDDPSTFTRPWALNYPLRRVGSGGACAECGAARVDDTDPYARESWEHACHEGNGHHVEGVRELGFKWFGGATPPAR
jgi:hypothetical protein